MPRKKKEKTLTFDGKQKALLSEALTLAQKVVAEQATVLEAVIPPGASIPNQELYNGMSGLIAQFEAEKKEMRQASYPFEGLHEEKKVLLLRGLAIAKARLEFFTMLFPNSDPRPAEALDGFRGVLETSSRFGARLTGAPESSVLESLLRDLARQQEEEEDSAESGLEKRMLDLTEIENLIKQEPVVFSTMAVGRLEPE